MLKTRIKQLSDSAKKWTALIGAATATLSLILVGVQNVIYRQEIALISEINDIKIECNSLRSNVKAVNEKYKYVDSRLKRLENGSN